MSNLRAFSVSNDILLLKFAIRVIKTSHGLTQENEFAFYPIVFHKIFCKTAKQSILDILAKLK